MLTKFRVLVIGVLASLSCAICLFIVPGCDVASSTESLVINPSSAVMSPGQTVTFTVSGGYSYTWSLDPNDGSGSLSALSGSQVTYTCLATNIGTTPKLVRVASTIEGSGETSTTSTYTNEAYEVDGQAQITYANGAGSSSSSDLAVSPSSASVATNGTQSFTVSGGTSPYSWSVFNSAIGTISSTTGSSTTYLRTGDGSNALTVEDSAGTSVSVVITQP
jgi:plastocyanin